MHIIIHFYYFTDMANANANAYIFQSYTGEGGNEDSNDEMDVDDENLDNNLFYNINDENWLDGEHTGNNSNDLKCKYCCARFFRPDHLTTHINCVHRNTKQKCLQCSFEGKNIIIIKNIL